MILAILQARVSSTRLPGKVLRPILGRALIAHQIERVRRARSLDRLVLATSDDPSDDPLADLARELGVELYRGALEDVLDRFHAAASEYTPEHVVRLTGDCPLTDPELIDRVVGAHLEAEADYTSNSLQRTYPDGLDVEVLRFSALQEAWREACLPSEREHVTPFVTARPERFRLQQVTHVEDLSDLRWVVDHEVDLEILTQVFERLYPTHPAFGMQDVLDLMRAEPTLFQANASIPMDEGWQLSLERDDAYLQLLRDGHDGKP